MLGEVATNCWQANAMPRKSDPSFIYLRRFGKRLRASREAAGYETYADFANAAGLEKETYRTYEAGIRQPKFHALVKISEMLGKTLDFLILGKVDREADPL